MKDFFYKEKYTVFYHVWRTRIDGSSFSTTHFKKIRARASIIEEIKGELEKEGIFDADVFCVINGHHDNILED